MDGREQAKGALCRVVCTAVLKDDTLGDEMW